MTRDVTDPDDLLAAKQAARLLGVRPNTLTRMHTDPPAGGAPPIAATTPGGQRRYSRAALLSWRDDRPEPYAHLAVSLARDPVTGRLLPRSPQSA